LKPSPRNLKFLYSNLWNNNFKNTEVFPIGLGDKCELRPIYGFGGISSFIQGWGQSRKNSYYLVPVTTLDTVLGSRFDGKRLLIKMDVEGFELEVLKGASGILETTPRPTWLVEIMFRNPLIPGGINPNFKETFELFWQHGYQCTTAGSANRDVSRDDVAHWAASGQVESLDGNFLFY
jgi:FkbM family methyltransferase